MTLTPRLLVLSQLTFIASGYNLACFNHDDSYDWEALRNATTAGNLPHLDIETASQMIRKSFTFPTNQLARECVVGNIVLRILIVIYVDDFEKMQFIKQGFPWVYLKSMLMVDNLYVVRLLWSHWNIFGVFNLFLSSLPKVPTPEMQRYTDKQAVECVKGENSGTFHECAPSLITHGIMESEDPELKAAGYLLLLRRLVSDSFNNTCDEDSNSVLVWKHRRWFGPDGIQDMAKKYLLASIPAPTMFQGCDGGRGLRESLPACWPPDVWGGRLVIPLLERMTKEWMFYVLRGQTSTSQLMKRIKENDPYQADFIHASLLVEDAFHALTDYYLHITPSITKNDRIVFSTPKKCWVVGFKAHACAHLPPPTAEAQCFNKAYPKARCCDEDVGEDAEAEAGTRDEKGNPLGTWATILFARDQASAQLLSETVCLLAYQIRGLEGSVRRPFVALTDRQTLEVLSTDIRARLLEQGVTLKTASKKILDLEDPRIPPHHINTTFWEIGGWHRLYLWDPDLWADYPKPLFFLDGDTLPVHKGLLEGFSLPPSITLAMGSQTPFRTADDELEVNIGVMVVHPNLLVFAQMANKILSGWGFPTPYYDQTWLDNFFRHFSVRHEMKVPGPHWGVWYESVLNDTKGHMITSKWEPRTVDLILPHIILPPAYDLWLAPHVIAKLPHMLPGFGHGIYRPFPRLLHYAGNFVKPWHRCSTSVRSLVDVMWWQAHTLMCSKSLYKPCFLECDQ